MKKKIIFILIFFLVILIGICFGVGLFNKNKPEENTTNENKSEQTLNEEKVKENIPTKEVFSASEINEDALEKEGFEESNPNFISSSTREEDKFIVGAKQSEPVYYSQIDSRWKNHPYTICGNPTQTIGSSGCGPTSAAMIVSTIKGTIIPPDMGDLFIQYGFRTVDNGTYYSAFPWVADYFDIEMERVYSTYDMADLVADGYIAVVSCGEGLWTTGGHFITVMENDDGTLMVYDPYLYNGKFDTAYRRQADVDVEGNAVYVTVQNFKDYSNAKAFWCYKWKDEDDPEPGPQPEPQPTPTEVTTKYVTANIGLNVRTGPGTNYPVVYALPNGTQVNVYEEEGNWSRIGDNRWACSDYLADVTPEPTPTPSRNTVGETKRFTNFTYLWSNPDLTGTRYDYKANTSIIILENISDDVDYIKVIQTGRKAYVNINAYGENYTPSTPVVSGYPLGRYKVVVNSVLNVRTGPGTNYRVKRTYSNGTVFDTYEIQGNWARTPSGWVCLDYARLLYTY